MILHRCRVSQYSWQPNIFLKLNSSIVPQVGLVSANVSVVENDPNAEVCLDLEGLVSEGVEISVTLELGSKPGSANQATGECRVAMQTTIALTNTALFTMYA